MGSDRLGGLSLRMYQDLSMVDMARDIGSGDGADAYESLWICYKSDLGSVRY